MAIHPTAIIDPAAKLDSSVEVGAYAVIEGPVQIGPHTKVHHHAYLTGWTEIGARCQIHPFTVVGHLPQDFHFEGQRSYCRIGDDTVIREYVSIHRGTDPESATVVGQECFLLAQSHVAHNCVLGDRVTLTNGTLLGGYTQVGQGAVLSVYALTHQFVRIGEYAMIAGAAHVVMDALPFMTMQQRNACSGVNLVGMRRAGFSKEEIQEIKQAYKLFYRSGRPLSATIPEFETTVATDAGRRLLDFIKAPSRRGLGAGPRHAYRHSRPTSEE